MPTIDMACAWEVRISKKDEHDSFKTRVSKICCFGKDPKDVLELDTVLVSGRDTEHCAHADHKTYIVYVVSNEVASAREKGINKIKDYRREQENCVD
jgi:hypothetical protein